MFIASEEDVTDTKQKELTILSLPSKNLSSQGNEQHLEHKSQYWEEAESEERILSPALRRAEEKKISV